MKKKEFQTYREKSLEDIEKELLSARERLATLKFDLLKGKVKNIREMRKEKKMIAQLLTLAKVKHSHK